MPYQKLIKIPDGVTVSLEGNALSVRGKKGELKRAFRHPRAKLKLAEKEITILTNSENRKDWAIVGTWNALIKNMITGVEKEYVANLKLIYTHFPITVKVAGSEVHLMNYLGEKSPRVAKITGRVRINVQKESVTVSGPDKYEVGQTAASIERLGMNKRRKDTRIFQDGVYLLGKVKPIS